MRLLYKGPGAMMKICVLAMVRVYQVVISPILGPRCRYIPSCSDYMVEAIEKFGIMRGVFMGLKRFGRCHPLSKAPLYDPVPDCPGCSKTKNIKNGEKDRVNRPEGQKEKKNYKIKQIDQ